jgi:hypothetical protein
VYVPFLLNKVRFGCAQRTSLLAKSTLSATLPDNFLYGGYPSIVALEVGQALEKSRCFGQTGWAEGKKQQKNIFTRFLLAPTSCQSTLSAAETYFGKKWGREGKHKHK